MDPRIKNALGGVAILALIFITLAAWNWSGAFARSAPAAATIAVSGQGKAVAAPDVAQFTFSIITEGGRDIAVLQKDNVAKTNAAVDFVKSQGVEAKDIETQGYNIEPRYQSFSCRPPEPGTAVTPCPPSQIVGYTITQTVQVKVRDFSKTGDLLAGVTSRGANNVSGLNFTVDNPSQLQNEARSKAIQDAKNQAAAMAKAGGFKLGRLVSVNEGPYPGPYPADLQLERNASVGNVAAPAPAPTIQPGSQELSAQVTLTYEIR